MKPTDEELVRFNALRKRDPVELASMIVELERSNEKLRARRPRVPRIVVKALASCFRAAKAGGFDGDTDDVTPYAADATAQWLARHLAQDG